MRHLIVLSMIVAGGALPLPATAAPVEQCTVAMSAKAEDASDHLKAWPALYAFYRSFKACDDGGVAEGVDDAVDQLLSRKWSTLDAFRTTLQTDKGFVAFVLRHINEDWSRADLALVRENALHHCPEGLTAFCEAVVKQIDTINAGA